MRSSDLLSCSLAGTSAFGLEVARIGSRHARMSPTCAKIHLLFHCFCITLEGMFQLLRELCVGALPFSHDSCVWRLCMKRCIPSTSLSCYRSAHNFSLRSKSTISHHGCPVLQQVQQEDGAVRQLGVQLLSALQLSCIRKTNL